MVILFLAFFRNKSKNQDRLSENLSDHELWEIGFLRDD